ncbi:MAG: hypothetical protein ACUZ8O_09430 [Candidatus Anammoxibacter sp.]
MFKCGFYILFALFFTSFVYAESHKEDMGHGEHNREVKSVRDIEALQVEGCDEESAVSVNAIDLDRNKFVQDCVKISLSENPEVTWASFDFPRHNVVIMKVDTEFDERVVGFDVAFERENGFFDFSGTWTYNFETGEFVGRPNGELRNIKEPAVSLVNTGEGVYDIWCRYHAFAGMVMELIVVE